MIYLVKSFLVHPLGNDGVLFKSCPKQAFILLTWQLLTNINTSYASKTNLVSCKELISLPNAPFPSIQ